MLGQMGEGEMDDDRGIVMEVEFVISMQNLGGRLVFIFIKAGILVFMVEVTVMGIMLFGEHSFLVTEVECLGVCFWLVRGVIFNLVGDFVAGVMEMEVEDLELVMKAVVRLFWGSFDRTFLGHISWGV